MADENLKACPFCGGRPIRQVVAFSDGPSEGDPRYIKCMDCHARSVMFDKTEDAIAAWNRRAPLSPSREDEVRKDERRICAEILERRDLCYFNNPTAKAALVSWVRGEPINEALGQIEPDLRSTPPPPAKSENEIRAEVWEEAAIEAEQERPVFLDRKGLADWDSIAAQRKQMRSEVAKACRERAKALRAPSTAERVKDPEKCAACDGKGGCCNEPCLKCDGEGRILKPQDAERVKEPTKGQEGV